MIRCLILTSLLFSTLHARQPVRSGMLAAGTRWETPWFITTSTRSGPTVLITGGIHGDEPAGACAAGQIRHWPILKGRLIVIPRTNITALNAGTRRIPGAQDPARDLNRNFPRLNEPNTIRGEPAGAVWSFIREQKPDWVIDLHEGYHFHRIEKKSVGSSIIDIKSKATNKVVPAMLSAVDATVTDPEKKFSRLSPPADGSLARAAAKHLGAEAMILETTRRDQPPSHRARQHRIMVHTLLARLGMIAPGTPNLVTPPGDPAAIRAAIFDGGGTSSKGWANVRKVVDGIPDSLLWHLGPDDIRDGALKHFDLVVFPGGSGSKQAATLGKTGRQEVREFVENGGGYVGICAGAYLAAANYKWSLAISNHKTFCETRDIPGVGRKSMWFRGPATTVTMELTTEGRQILGNREGVFEVRYQNGPIVSPAGKEDLPDYRVLAWFRSENAAYDTQKGTMTNTPAIIASDFGKGRVLCISPHPESASTLRPMASQGLRWTAGNP
jgi:predicted deacylase/glutamine amidotransferase-like uncharacterized protein